MVTHKSRAFSRRLSYSWILTTGSALLVRPCVRAEHFDVGSVYVHRLVGGASDSAQDYQLWVCSPARGLGKGSDLVWQAAPLDPFADFPHPEPHVPLFLRYLPEVGRPSWVLMKSKDRYRQKKEELELDEEPAVVGDDGADFS